MDVASMLETRKQNEQILASMASTLWALKIDVPHNYQLRHCFEIGETEGSVIEISLDTAKLILRNVYIESPFIVVENSGLNDDDLVDLNSYRVLSGFKETIFKDARKVVTDAFTLVEMQSYFDCPSVVILGVDIESNSNSDKSKSFNILTKYFQFKNTSEYPLNIERKIVYIDGIYYSCVVFTGSDRFDTHGRYKKIIIPILAFGESIDENPGIYHLHV